MGDGAAEVVDVPVLVVGGGPVGLTMALLLDRFGVDCLVSERQPTTTDHPKSRGCTVRTMELFRLWGIEDAVRAGGLGPDADIVHWCESLSGPFVGTTHPEPSIAGPAKKSVAPQNAVEAALAGALVGARHAELRRLTEVVELGQDDDGVHAIVRHVGTGAETRVRARYAVACDGAASGVRRDLGIEMDGPRELARIANHYYRADLSHLPHMKTAVGYIVRPSDPARKPFELLASTADCDHFLYLQPLRDEGDQPMSEAELAELVREQVELPDLEVERISVLVWRMSAQVAQRYRQGNVFLAGDAAHRFPPAGGQGLNSGVADAHNLAWKLALVMRGLAEPELLDTYEVERKPVAESNSSWSTGNFERMARATKALANRHDDPVAWREAMLENDDHIHSEGQAMGYVYERGAVVDDGSPVLPHDPRYYWPTDRPGARYPHMWVDVAWSESTIDWFDRDFVVVCGPEADAWQAAAEAVAADVAVPLVVRRLQTLAGPLEMGRDGAVLVRPDGHVAWRSRSALDDPERALRAVLEAVLAGGTEAADR